MKRWIAGALVGLGGWVWAVTPQVWDQKTEADFARGKFDGTVVTSRGEIGLAREIDILFSGKKAPPVISAVLEKDGEIYAASGTEAVVYRIAEGNAEPFCQLPGTMVASLALEADGTMLAGVGGEEAGLYRIDEKGQPTKLWSEEKVKYLWAILPGPSGKIYVATGPTGTIYALDSEGQGEALYTAGELAKNILCLARDANTLYAGTDQNGLVLAIDLKEKTSRVLLDAEEKEISALVSDGAGGLYAATADTAKASADGKVSPSGGAVGKTASSATSQPELPPTSQPASSPAAATDEVQAPAEDESADEFFEEADSQAEESSSADPATISNPTLKEDAEKDPMVSRRQGRSFPDGPMNGDPFLNESQAGEDPSEENVSIEPESPDGDEIDSPPGEDGGDHAPMAEMMNVPAPRRNGPPVRGQGNAIYYIRPDGLVDTLFRRPVTILAMRMDGDRLLLATGNDGALFHVSLDGDVVAELANTDAAQITSLAAGAEGQIIFGTANAGSVGRLHQALNRQGTFTSEALDAKQLAQWGTMKIRASLPGDTSATVKTRSGNVSKPEDDTWSSWSKATPVSGSYLEIGSPAGRFLQYRFELEGEGKQSPQIEAIQLIYQVGNLAPAIAAVEVEASDKPSPNKKPTGPQNYRIVSINASDPNGDPLRYQIAFREIGTREWIEIEEKLDQPKYVWDTRTVGDGIYELRITASDVPGNPPGLALESIRISEPVVVDNTAPIVQALEAGQADGKVRLRGSASDSLSRITAISYAINSQKDWVVVAAEDGIYDSSRESFQVELDDLKPGTHRVSVQACDEYGNLGYASVTVTISK